jgi:hypothetical protein
MSRLVPGAIVASIAAALVAVTGVFGSSHREAPGILKDPTADNTDVYAFTAPDAPGSVTFVANWIPLEEPAGGPYFGKLDPKARYYVKIDNTGDGYEDVAYRWVFHQRFRNPNSFLYAAPQVTSADDPDINFVQTYDLYRVTYKNRRETGERLILRNAPVAPDNVGPKTIPNYEPVWMSAIKNVGGGGKSFVGPADDPFFVDLGAVFDGINIDKPGRPNIGLGNQGGGRDDVSGYNTHSFVLQVPEAAVTKDNRSVSNANSPNAVIGVWATTERQKMSVLKGNRRPEWVQVSRLGNPLVNEVVVPIGQKDKYNATSPANDLRNFGTFILNPEPARLLNGLFGLGVKENDRSDLAAALGTGVAGLNQISKKPAVADTLKLNLGVPPSANPNRFGVLANDLAGFPNGRRLGDDVTDIELRVIAGALLKPEQGGKQIPLGDGVDQNDLPFRSSFPYVAMPHDGFGGLAKRTEPGHAPVPQPPA